MPSDGMNVTLTVLGSIVGAAEELEDGDRGTEPVAARIRPQLEEEGGQALVWCGDGGKTYFASSP